MAQQSSKKSSGGAAKFAANTTKTASRASLSAVDTTRNSAESVMRYGAEAMKEFMSAGAEEAQKAQEKAFAIGRESAENIARTADAATKTINETISMSRENVEAVVECGNIVVNIGKSITNEAYNFANNLFSDNVEMSKEMFSCRTVNELFDLYSKMIRINVDSVFNESVRMSELMFQFATEAAEPINERIADTTDRFSKALAA